MSTKVAEFLDDLDGGVFSEKLATALSDVGAGVTTHGKSGSVTVTLSFKQIGNSNQVQIDHTLKYTKPTAKGKVSEENSTATPMHVGKGGALSLWPENQDDMFRQKTT